MLSIFLQSLLKSVSTSCSSLSLAAPLKRFILDAYNGPDKKTLTFYSSCYFWNMFNNGTDIATRKPLLSTDSKRPIDIRHDWSLARASHMCNGLEFSRFYHMELYIFIKICLVYDGRGLKPEKMDIRLRGPHAFAWGSTSNSFCKMMAGNTVWRTMALFEVRRSAVYQVFHKNKDITNNGVSLSDILETVPALEKLAIDRLLSDKG